MHPTRRRALFILAAATAPIGARAQDVTAPEAAPQPLPPAPLPPAPLPQLIPPPAPHIQPARPTIIVTNPTPPASPTIAAPGPIPGTAAIDRTKRYIVFFDQNIDVNSMKALRRQLTTLVEAGVQDILLCIHSGGGLVDPMLATYSFIRALPARIDTHATSFVMSAASTLFLAGENRSANHTARFLFHPSQVQVPGLLNGPQMQDRLTQFDTVDGVSRQIYRDRTSLTDEQIDRFRREETYFTAEQARDAGIVQTVKDLHIPGPDKARILFID